MYQLIVSGKRLTILQANSTIFPPNCFHPAFPIMRSEKFLYLLEEQERLGCKTLTFKWLTVVVIRER